MRLKDCFDHEWISLKPDCHPAENEPWFVIHELIVDAAAGRRGPVYLRGKELNSKPVHQHVTAEGICD